VHPYVISLGFASLVSAACGGAVFLHQRQHRGNQLAGLLLLGCGYWALMELLANLAVDAASASQLFRLSCVGPNLIGPLFLHIFLETTGDDRPPFRWLRNGLYAMGAGLSALALTSDLFMAGATASYWGYHLQVGPLFPLAYLAGAVGATTGLALGFGLVDRLSDGERMQLPWLIAGAALPMAISGATDLVLPMLGIHFPPLGSIALAFVALLIVWIDVRFGYSLLTPGSFATEILETLPDGVALLRPDDRIRSANRGLSRLAGRPAESLQDLPIGELLSWSFDADEFDEVDCDLVNRDGARIPVTVAGSSLYDRLGNNLGRVLVVRDLREVADLRRRLVTSARLAAVGELAAGIAHEINNPLAFVRSNLSQLETSWKHLREVLPVPDASDETRFAMDDVEELVADSVEGVDRAAEIIRGVKSFSHAGTGARERTDLNALLEDVLRVAAPQLRQRIQIERDYATLPPIECTRQSLRQVFLNLVLNASQAIESGGTILVRSRAVDGGVTVDVADDGCGIVPEIIDRIFDPFFTTKGVGEGTGLGLGIAYQIVQQHNGTIQVESSPGLGACFSVTLPS
jgi:two-component system NtrC family sensor kinase